MTAEEIIQALGLEPLPVEGGLTTQTYLSRFSIDGQPAGTAIYYLLRGSAFSHLHQLTGDEMYHFYLGDPVELTQLLPERGEWEQLLGIARLTERTFSSFLTGQCVEAVILGTMFFVTMTVLGLPYPLLIGASRKGCVGAATGREAPEERLYGTLAVTALCCRQGADIIRVHDVRENKDVIKMTEAIQGAEYV